MDFIVKLFYSILFILMGFYLIKYRKNVHDWTGNWAWADKYLGSGGTFTILILFGLFLIFLGVIHPFGGLSLLRGD